MKKRMTPSRLVHEIHDKNGNPRDHKKAGGSHWMVPFGRNQQFRGRKHEINALEDMISKQDGPRNIAITGLKEVENSSPEEDQKPQLEEVGKSQLALELAYRIRNQDEEYSIFWIPSTSHDAVEQAYIDIAQMLGMQDLKPNDAKLRVQSYLSLEDAGKWLLIFDDADDMDMWVKGSNTGPALIDFLPKSEQGQVLFTTRNRDLAEKLASSNIISLPELDKEETVPKVQLTNDDYTVGWICALPLEMAAAQAMLDDEHPPLPIPKHDSNNYVLGEIDRHNVVIACLPVGSYGTSAAATVASQMLASFPSIRFGMMVGIGGGVPGSGRDIRLGDVVVSQPTEFSNGIIQYDFGKRTVDGQLKITSKLNKPPQVLLTAISKLQASHMKGPNQIEQLVDEMLHRNPIMKHKFQSPGQDHDQLFETEYDHLGNNLPCDFCDPSRVVARPPRKNTCPIIYYGAIASGNQVMKDGRTRDALARELGVLCFEMEAAGLMDYFPCVVIRGICDYADSHKNKEWQGYAAVVAAAYAKELLLVTSSTHTRTSLTITRLQVIWKAVEEVDLNSFLSAIKDDLQEIYFRQLRHRADLKDSFRWVLDNMDFQPWCSENNQCYRLWVSCPEYMNVQDLSVFLIHQSQSQYVNTDNSSITLYFLGAVRSSDSALLQFVRTILCQFLRSLPLGWQERILRDFLKRLVKDAQGWQDESFSKKSSTPTAADVVLSAPMTAIWPAFVWLLANGVAQKLTIILDSVGETEKEYQELVQSFCELTEHLLAQKKGLKVLVTSQLLLTLRPQLWLSKKLEKFTSIQYDQERKEFLQGLRFKNARYDSISKEFTGSYKWLQNHPEYIDWASYQYSRLLYIQGKPGSGKSTLMKYYLDSLCATKDKSTITAGFFYSYRDGGMQRSHYNMLRSILHTIVEKSESFFYFMQPEYRKYKDLLREKRDQNYEKELYFFFKKMISAMADHPPLDRVLIIVDAVDESDEADRREIIELLLNLCSRPKQCRIKVFIASRPAVEIENRRSRLPPYNFIRLQDHTRGDISRFTHSQLKDVEDEGFSHRIVEYIVDHAQGVFLWVKLVCELLQDYLDRANSQHDIMRFLAKLPKDLEAFYEMILEHLKDQKPEDRRDTIKMFQFVLFAMRPLRVSELHHSLVALEDIDPTLVRTEEDFNCLIPNPVSPQKGPSPIERRIISCSGNFLETKQQEDGFRIVQAMHQTVREFLLHPDKPARSAFALTPEAAHMSISVICFRYLIICIGMMPVPVDPDNVQQLLVGYYCDLVAEFLATRPLLSYVIRYLNEHFSYCEEEPAVCLLLSQIAECVEKKKVAMYLLHRFLKAALPSRFALRGSEEIIGSLTTHVLQSAIRLGIAEAVDIMLASGVNTETYIDGEDPPIILAAGAGSVKVLKLLIHNGAKTNVRTRQGETPLEIAVSCGHTAIIRYFLEPERTGHARLEDMLLHRAARHGHRDVVHLLLDTGYQIDAQNSKGQTPLYLAVDHGNVDVVRFLLEKGARHTMPEAGNTILHLAAEKVTGATIAELLLQYGAKKNARNCSGDQGSQETPLHVAAGKGSVAVAHILLEQGAKVNIRDQYNQVALHWAAAENQVDIVKLLLKYKASVNIAGFTGKTALHLAVHNASIDVEAACTIAQLLLRAGANINAKDENGLTPLHVAVRNHSFSQTSCSRIVKLLLKNRADVNAKDHKAWTPLHCVVTQVCLLYDKADDVIQILIRAGANIRAQDKQGQTPIDLAKANHADILARFLAEKVDLPENSSSMSSCTVT